MGRAVIFACAVVHAMGNCDLAPYAFCCTVGVKCDCSKGIAASGQCAGNISIPVLGAVTSYAYCCGIGTPCDCKSLPSLDTNATALAAAASKGSGKDGNIYIIRHGEKNPEGDLSHIGRKRAKFIATIFPGSEFNAPSALFAGHYGGGTPQRTLHTMQPVADKLGLKVDNSFKNEDHSGAASAMLAEVKKGKTVLAAWEHCNIRKTCYALASQSMCDEAFTQNTNSDCDWWEVCSGCSDHYDGVVSLTVKNGKVTAVEHHHENFSQFSSDADFEVV